MSELTLCNYCSLRRIKTQARKDGKRVKVTAALYEGELRKFVVQGGVDVFVDGKKVAWFMELPNHCCC